MTLSCMLSELSLNDFPECDSQCIRIASTSYFPRRAIEADNGEIAGYENDPRTGESNLSPACSTIMRQPSLPLHLLKDVDFRAPGAHNLFSCRHASLNSDPCS